MKPYFSFVLLLLLVSLTACSMIPAQGQSGVEVTTTPTDCGCDIDSIFAATPTGGIGAPAPVGPAGDTPTPAALESFRDQWKTYSNSEYGFSFEYPAVYDGQEFGFCAVRDSSSAPEDALAAINLGSRTQLTLNSMEGSDLQAAAEAFRGDPGRKDFQFDAPQERSVDGVPALVLPYRSGGTNRYAESTFFIRDGVLYRIDTGVPSACDIPAIELKELDAYTRMLDSFQFAP